VPDEKKTKKELEEIVKHLVARVDELETSRLELLDRLDNAEGGGEKDSVTGLAELGPRDVLRISSVSPRGFSRCGIRFEKEASYFELSAFNDSDMARLEGEDNLRFQKIHIEK